jgi:hypothetical protein
VEFPGEAKLRDPQAKGGSFFVHHDTQVHRNKFDQHWICQRLKQCRIEKSGSARFNDRRFG